MRIIYAKKLVFYEKSLVEKYIFPQKPGFYSPCVSPFIVKASYFCALVMIVQKWDAFVIGMHYSTFRVLNMAIVDEG